jgi:hypothetical protein
MHAAPRVVPGIGQGIAADVAQHVREGGEGHAGLSGGSMTHKAARELGRAACGMNCRFAGSIHRCANNDLQRPKFLRF